MQTLYMKHLTTCNVTPYHVPTPTMTFNLDSSYNIQWVQHKKMKNCEKQNKAIKDKFDMMVEGKNKL